MSGLRSGVAISTFGNLVTPLAGLITAPVLAQSLGVVGRGEVAAATTPLFLATSVFTLGLPEALTYFAAKRPAREGWTVSISLIALGALGFVGTLLIAVLTPFLSADDESLGRMILLASIACTPSLVQAGLRGLAYAYRAWWLVTSDRILSSASRLVIICALALSSTLTPTSATLAIAWTSVAGILVYLALPFRRHVVEERAAAAPFSALVAFGGRVWIGSLAGILLSRVDQTLMVPFAGAYALGIYTVAVTVSEIALVFNAAVRDVTFSLESARQDQSRLEAATRVSTLITLAAAIGVGLLSIWAIPFFFGGEFSEAVVVVFVLLIGLVLGNPGSVSGAGLRARGRPGLASWSLVIGMTVNLLALVLWVPDHGAIGAAWATTAGSIAAGGMNVFWLRTRFGVPVRNLLLFRRADPAELLRTGTRLRRMARRDVRETSGRGSD
ncbi:oligosaccharide flippase family protein [Agromyces sp. Marseille-P2726]|uniref:oligosaccharide flippase family protein n=1 Tax=Agromyces sp. Marseille-P2726 TaxID=2709132 RepID=UPI0015704029|nr:oligosaccharide flippase family protein [Agromyces sp. Marseille-P2726]